MYNNKWAPSLLTRNSSGAKQPLSYVNNWSISSKKKTSLKTGFAQISLAAQKIWVAQNLGGLQPPPAPPARTPMVGQSVSQSVSQPLVIYHDLHTSHV